MDFSMQDLGVTAITIAGVLFFLYLLIHVAFNLSKLYRDTVADMSISVTSGYQDFAKYLENSATALNESYYYSTTKNKWEF